MRIGRNHWSNVNRLMQWALVLALATIALATAGTDSTLAAPDDALSRDDVRTACLMSGGTFWKSGSAYGCDLGGLTIVCDGAGSCEYWCDETKGCSCEGRGDEIICIYGFEPIDSGSPWHDDMQFDPYREAKLPDRSGSGPSSPGPVIAPGTVIVSDDQVTKGIEP